MTDALGAYTAFVRAKFHEMLAYRLRYYTGIVSYLVYVSTYFFLWRAVYTHRADGESLHGFDLDSLVTYVAIGWLARFFISAVEVMCVMARACGHRHLNQFSIDDLTTWKREMHHLTGIAYGGVKP